MEKLSKTQRKRRNRRQKDLEKADFENRLGPRPGHLDIPGMQIELSEPPGTLDSIENAPPHFIDSSDPTGNYAWNIDAIRNVAERASQSRSKEKASKIRELRKKYSEIWYQRGAAKKIAITETEQGNEISERTVQAYIKEAKD